MIAVVVTFCGSGTESLKVIQNHKTDPLRGLLTNLILIDRKSVERQVLTTWPTDTRDRTSHTQVVVLTAWVRSKL